MNDVFALVVGLAVGYGIRAAGLIVVRKAHSDQEAEGDKAFQDFAKDLNAYQSKQEAK